MWTDADGEEGRPSDLEARVWFLMDTQLATTIAGLLVDCHQMIEEARCRWDAVQVDRWLVRLDHHADGLIHVAVDAEARRMANPGSGRVGVVDSIELGLA